MADCSIVDALRDLYIECGGDPSKLKDNHNAADYIKDLKHIINQGGGGGSDTFIVTFTYDGEGNLVSDKTFSETLEAYNAGSTIIFRNIWTGNPPGSFGRIEAIAMHAREVYGSEPDLRYVDSFEATFIETQWNIPSEGDAEAQWLNLTHIIWNSEGRLIEAYSSINFDG